MKKLVLLFLSTYFAFEINAQTLNVAFDKEVFDFGKIIQDKPVTVNFTFTNNEKKPVLVEVATASCGCTTPTWPQKPVLAGKKGIVSAGFNAKAVGTFEKTITVQYQGNFRKDIKIKGEVLTPDAFAKLKPAKRKV